MKVLNVFLFACCSVAWAQTAPAPGPGGTPAPQMPDIPDQTTIAVFDDGVKLTMADFKKIFAVLPPDNQPMALRDRKTFLQQWAFMRKLAQMAEKQKLDLESPAREQLDYSRLMILSQAELAGALNSIIVEPAEIVKSYDTDKERFKEIRVKAIYVSFGKGGKAPSEDEAKAKAARLLAEIRGGADFVKLVKENSDDETSKAKDGDFATLRRNDNIPDAIRAGARGVMHFARAMAQIPATPAAAIAVALDHCPPSGGPIRRVASPGDGRHVVGEGGQPEFADQRPDGPDQEAQEAS